ncbi:MAG: glutamine-synthetase adenylyltransferase, partial [Mangrovicoccus sp.]
AKPLYVKALRRAMAILSERTAEGYVFRTDLRLRPDPSVNPVAVPMSSAMRYYESLGRTWERAAFIKARPCAGDRRAGREFLRDIRPFVWRKLLDFATVAEIQDMRGKIRVEKGQLDNSAAEALDGVSVKLGRGGIRQIEFFTQTRQLIAGGRDPELRVKGTCDGLEMLCRKGWVTREDATRLTRHYRRLRQIENRVQMVADAQTHSLPANPESWARLAAFLGAADAASLRRELSEIMEEVHCLTEPLFSQDQHSKPARETNSPELAEKIQAWDRYPALRSERARGLLRRLIPVLAEGFSKAPRPEEALSRFEGFVAGLPAGVQLFSLFDANPHLIDLLVGIVSTSPGLAQYLSRNSQVLDAVVDGEFFAPWPGAQALLADLGLQLEHDVADYEQKLDATRRWHKDWHFRIGVHFLRGAISARQAGREYTELAEAVLRGLWPEVEAEFARRHGPPPGRGACVIGMGSLGGYQVGPSSDLDLIVIYDADPNDMSQGRKPLPASRYYARFTQALITALSTKTAEGGLYEVDMRLRPSGRQGPVATSWRAFQGYQKTEAWTWEHLALTRARPIAGAGSLAKDFDAFRQDIIAQPREPSQVMRDLQDMRQRLAEAKPRPDLWTPRRGFGGGQDIE